MSVKQQVLDCLEKNRGIVVSGQELAEKLGVSRNSIWRAVKSLREEGYRIDSGTNRGYVFSDENDILSEEGIRLYLPKSASGIELHVFDEIDSTNNEAKRMLAAGFSGTAAIVANCQTGGRGRRGRSFYSPKGGGVYVTLILQNESTTSDAVLITMAAALATVHAIEKSCSDKPKIKWVNDVYVEDKKVSGILTEGISDLETGSIQSVVVGIGVNVGKQEFPPELAEKAGYVSLKPGFTRNMLVAAMIGNLLELNTLSDQKQSSQESGETGERKSGKQSLLDQYRSYSLVFGREVEFELEGKKRRSRAIDIDETGGLIVEDDSGERLVLHGGEVSIAL
ncbi:MAG: biotin--[acetyl-CoA-carboxylase] ligase [Coriobacteriales bacterium]|jgi:BirA family biotin operon repressor/biotin-[acetyl-CoA-carboxylase] ligase